MMLWLSLLITQPLLIALKHHTLHKQLGQVSKPLIALLILSALMLIFDRFYIDQEKGLSLTLNLAIRGISIITLTTLATCYALGIKHKNNIATHMRYMIGTAFTMIPASATRLLYFLKVNSTFAELSVLIILDIVIIYLLFKDHKKGVSTQAYKVILAFHLGLTLYYCFMLAFTLNS